jgi:sugar/nucleoside kinase (ribokinase family)
VKCLSGPGILVIGDVLVDAIATPCAPVELGIEALEHVRADIEFRLGGTGVHLANAAISQGLRPVYLLCSVDLSQISAYFDGNVFQQLSATGITIIGEDGLGGKPGMTIVIYLPKYRRILLADPGAADQPLASTVLSTAKEVLGSCGLLVVSGYSLFRDGSRQDTVELMNTAKESGVAVVLDLVPHSISKSLPVDELIAYLKPVDLLSAKAGTLLGFAQRLAPSRPGEPRLSEAVELFLDHLDEVVVFQDDLSCQTFSRFGMSLTRPASPENAVLTGLTDRVLMSLIREIYSSKW